MRGYEEFKNRPETWYDKLIRTGQYTVVAFPLVSLFIWGVACTVVLSGQVFKSHIDYQYMDMHHYLGVPEFLDQARLIFPYVIDFSIFGAIIGGLMIFWGKHRKDQIFEAERLALKKQKEAELNEQHHIEKQIKADRFHKHD